ncbi:hypothetical protein LCGC14_2306540, partial [marine sediment metagenome]
IIQPLNEYTVIKHTGGINGFLAHARYIPEQKLYVAVLANSNHINPIFINEKLTARALGIALPEFKKADVTEQQLDAVADLADQYSLGEIRTTHNQNLVLADVKKSDLFELWQKAKAGGFATPNIGTLTDMICCPGGDFCSLANAKSIPVAEALQRKFDDMDYVYDLGDLSLNISGCMNACGHHHVGNIGILGVDKKGEEFYQVQLGGSSDSDATLGKVLGPSFGREEMPEVIEKILNVYVENRQGDELFLDTYRRIGLTPFKESVYAKDH